MKIRVEIEGITSLLMNKFNDSSLEGNTRDKNETPREAAHKTAYLSENNVLYYPAENIFACIVSKFFCKCFIRNKIRIANETNSLCSYKKFQKIEKNAEICEFCRSLQICA